MEKHSGGSWMRDYVKTVRAPLHGWQVQSKLIFESGYYWLKLSVSLFTLEPIYQPNSAMYIAAVNPCMCGVTT
jgi:hypothetical protein|tara:strand:+ start:186 stop:404 length:219 start_codon:yes stop_codon:yes gene_type:complete